MVELFPIWRRGRAGAVHIHSYLDSSSDVYFGESVLGGSEGSKERRVRAAEGVWRFLLQIIQVHPIITVQGPNCTSCTNCNYYGYIFDRLFDFFFL